MYLINKQQIFYSDIKDAVFNAINKYALSPFWRCCYENTLRIFIECNSAYEKRIKEAEAYISDILKFNIILKAVPIGEITNIKDYLKVQDVQKPKYFL
ncbi:MAG: hypothetical protein GY730_02345 [bacterium]|nr:hypothetical protein [bacterium]